MPSSNQNPVGNSKAAKFVAANPLAPLADPFSGMGDDEKEFHKEVSNNVQTRLEKAMEELKEKHRTGTNEVDDVDRAPTGSAYKALHQQQRQLAKETALSREKREAEDRMKDNMEIMSVKEKVRRMKFSEAGDALADGSDDSDDEYDHLLDEEDPVLTKLRQTRLSQLKQEQMERATNLSLGHGTLRTITQDEFLGECTGSSRFVCVHFFHDDFERCKIMDSRLGTIAQKHIECKFLRIDAAKAPFFVAKLKIKTLPSLYVYEHGKEIGRLVGFEGLAKDPTKPDEWETAKLQQWIADKGAIKYAKTSKEMEEERQRLGIFFRGAVYSDRETGDIDEEY